MSEGLQFTGGFVNGRCYARKAVLDGPPLYYNGDLHFQAHQVGWILCGTFTLISTIASFWLVDKHLQWYTNPKEQRYIVRLLFMVPIYASISFASFLFWNHSTPLILVRDCYEAIVLTSFFYLLLTYLSPNPDEQKDIFRLNGISRENNRQRRRKGLKPQKWVFPLGFLKTRPADGLYFLQIMKWAVLQYTVVRPVTTLAAVILDYAGLYCEVSLSPGWGHLYIIVIISISVSVAMYCLIQVYVVVSEQLKPHHPLLKLFSVKAIVFLTFWQATGLSFLVTLHLIKDTQYMTAENVSIGIGAILECLEMTIFAFLHIKCFTYKVYVPDPLTIEGELKDHRTPRLKSFGHAMNPMETFREFRAGTVYMFQMWKGEETDKQARRIAAHQGVFGHSRSRVLSDGSAQTDSLIRGGQEKRRENNALSPLRRIESGRLDEVLVDVEREVFLGSERQWLGVDDAHACVTGTIKREKSEGFEDQVVRELYNRGYTLREANKHNRGGSVPRDADVEQGFVRGGSRRRSWWQNIYHRISQSGGEDEQEKNLTPHPKRKSVSRPKDSAQALPLIQETHVSIPGCVYDDPPPPSALCAYRSARSPDDQRMISSSAPPLVTPLNVVHQPTEPIRSKANPPVQLGRSDSLLDRVFTYFGNDAHASNTDLDHYTESQPSRPASLWRAGSADVIPKHVEQRSSVKQGNVSDIIHPKLIVPVRGSVVGVECVPSPDERPPTPPPKRSHFRETANHSMTPSPSPLPQRLSLPCDPPVQDESPASPQLPSQPPGIPEPSAAYNLMFPSPPPHTDHDPRRHGLERISPVDPRGVGSFPMPDPQMRPPPLQFLNPEPSSPPSPRRFRPAMRNEALLRPFPEPAYRHRPKGHTRYTPTRSKLTVPAPLAQPLPRGTGSLRRNRANSVPPQNQQHVVSNWGPEPHPRRHSQPTPAPRHITDPNYVQHPPSRPPRNPHRRTPRPLSVLQEVSNHGVTPPPSPPQRLQRVSSPPLSALPPSKPNRSNALRKSPGSRSPTRDANPRTSLLAELRSVPPLDDVSSSRYPAIGPGSGIRSSPRNSRMRSPPSPRTPTFVNTHMLPPPSSPRSDVEEWASAVSSFLPSARVRT